MWVDLQGAELKALTGASRVLPKVKLIHAEVSFRPVYIGQPLFWEVNRFMRTHGFRRHKLMGLSPLKRIICLQRVVASPVWFCAAVYVNRRVG